MFVDVPDEGYASCCAIIEKMDLTDGLPNIGAPTLIIAASPSPRSSRPRPVHLDINWPILLTLAPLACYMCGALGLTFGTRFDPRTVPMLFGIVVLPLTFLGAIYYSWSSLAPIAWLQVFVLVNPLVYMCEGFRAALDDERAHEPLGRLPGDDRLLGPLHLARDQRLQEAGPLLSASGSGRSGREAVGCFPKANVGILPVQCRGA